MEGAGSEGFGKVVGEDAVCGGVSGGLSWEGGVRTTASYVEDFVGGLDIEPLDGFGG